MPNASQLGGEVEDGGGIRLMVTRVRQGDRMLFIGEFCPDVLLKYTKVDVWNDDKMDYDPAEQGYQRLEQRLHYSKVGKYIANDKTAMMPTSVLLSVRKPIRFEPLANANGSVGFLSIPKESLPLYIVDGQHRIAGLRYAVEELGQEEARNFCLPGVLMAEIDKVSEMSQFYLVNTTGRKIVTDLAERLLTEIKDQNLLGKKADHLPRSLKIADLLYEREGSPWQGRLQRPNKTKVGEVVLGESSFTKSIKPIMMMPTMEAASPEYVAERLNRYWVAIASFMPKAFADPRNYSIQKTTGVFVMHQLAPYVLDATRNAKYTTEAIKEVLAPAAEEYLNDDFWFKGGEAGNFSSGSGQANLFRKIKAELNLSGVVDDDSEE